MKLLAIDPGSSRMGAAWFHLNDQAETFALVRAEAVNTTKWKMPERVAWLRNIDPARPDLIAIERPGHHPFKSQAAERSLFELIGFLGGAATALGFQVRHIDDGTVKLALAGRPNAHKYEVHWAIQQLGYDLPWPGGRQDERPRGADRRALCESCKSSQVDPRHSADAADAIAVGHVMASGIFMARREL